jgi:hypothetical protein
MTYIVLQHGRAQTLSYINGTPRHGLLLSGKVGTLFRTRDAARRAIDRTNRYAVANGLGWDKAYTIQGVSR